MRCKRQHVCIALLQQAGRLQVLVCRGNTGVRRTLGATPWPAQSRDEACAPAGRPISLSGLCTMNTKLSLCLGQLTFISCAVVWVCFSGQVANTIILCRQASATMSSLLLKGLWYLRTLKQLRGRLAHRAGALCEWAAAHHGARTLSMPLWLRCTYRSTSSPSSCRVHSSEEYTSMW